MSIRVFAPAKINITLEVGAPRADGLHPLQSAVVFADVGDWVEASSADTLSLAIDGPFANGLRADEENLVLAAARSLGARSGAALRLTKNLPIASGIGGGSADAAAALRALNQLWALGLSESDLEHRSAKLGGDVPACVRARACWMTGVGEKLAPLNAPSLHAVLVNPRVPLATAAVYKAFDSAGMGRMFSPTAAPDWRDFEHVARDAAVRGNDLARAAAGILPEIDRVIALLRDDHAVQYANVSGSGATCFALVQDRDSAVGLAARVGAQRPNWWVVPTVLNAA
jgi:4-diphosphocytidyl-2-C-methyl-D-erythritol kinase